MKNEVLSNLLYTNMVNTVQSKNNSDHGATVTPGHAGL